MSPKEIAKNRNEDAMRLLMSQVNGHLEKIALGGGPKRIEKEHKKGKFTARERIDRLIDKESTFYELGAFAGFGMYEEYGGCPAAGVVAGIGTVSGRQCMIIANDATVKAGAWFPIAGKKNLRMQEIAIENRLPLIYLVDSAGVFLPLQDEIFPDKEHFGRIFRNNARISSMGIPQIAAIMGSCVAGGAYLPIMSDESLIVEGTGSIFLAGPYLVKAAIGEDVDAETLGGAMTQTEISGVCDYKMPDEATCLKTIRGLVDKFGPAKKAEFNRKESVKPAVELESIYNVFPEKGAKPYEMRSLIECLVDATEIEEYKSDYGKSIVCCYARIDGWAVGIVANQREIIKNAKGEMQFGGVIYSDSADKAARFIMNCNQKKIPLIFLQDVTGFMVGSRSEHGGIIKDGAKMVNAVSNSVVPKITIIVGNSYGAGNYAMCGKAYDPRFIFAWPTAKVAVMGGGSAAKTILQIQKSSLKKQGKTIDEKEEKALLDEITNKYESQTTPYYAASRLWVDDIIDPAKTRDYISMCISAANNAPIEADFNLGVLQT